MSNKIYLVRHGENVANITKEFSYKKVDYSLTTKGELQAKQTSMFFINKNIDYICSSPLKRAVETAKIIADELNLKYEINESFREINVGELEGKEPNKKTWDVFYKVVENWLGEKPEMKFPGGENLLQLVGRFRTGIIETIKNKKEKTIIIVGHGGIFTHGIIELSNIKNKQEFYDQDNSNCSITEIKVNEENETIEIEVIHWASVEHLTGEAAKVVSGLFK